MNLSSQQRQFVVVGLCVVPLAINFALNGLLGLWMFGELELVPTWALQSAAAPDLVGTCFFLPFITCLLVTPLVGRGVRGGAVAPLSGAEALPDWLQPFHKSLVVRALLFGLTCLVLAGGAVAVWLLLEGPGHFEVAPYLWLKAGFSAMLGGVVTPFIGLVALADPQARVQAA